MSPTNYNLEMERGNKLFQNETEETSKKPIVTNKTPKKKKRKK
jgi:hypothetical protein